jgi:drug/metabolite transporter (DMT)-like permease
MILYLALTLSAILAAAGQVLLKLGAQGQVHALGVVNVKVFGGLCLYAIGMVMWLWALSRVPLQVVYPFTMLTLVIVFIASIIVWPIVHPPPSTNGSPLRVSGPSGASLIRSGFDKLNRGGW